MDITHVLSMNPFSPAYRHPGHRPPSRRSDHQDAGRSGPLSWTEHEGGVFELGHSGPAFAFDNEGPRHEVVLTPFRSADRLATNGEWLEFIDDGGYRRPDLWMSDGWAEVASQHWDTPLY